jgi:hypothetical protein
MRIIAAALLLASAAPALAATDDTPAPMDLVWDATDVNGVAVNPKWGLQVTDPGALPDVPQLCFVQPDGPFDSSLCSTQVVSVDRPAGLRKLICSIGKTTSLPGHANWYPGTFEGPIYWDSLSFADRDNNVRLIPAEKNALTANNPDNIKGEFDSRETTNHFATPWWARFRRARTAVKKVMIDGKPSIISGFTSVDCEHHCVSELHPTWVLAIHVKDDPDDDVWAVFMRNWGNEGFCSSAQHEVSWPRDRFTLALPWRAGAAAVELDDDATRFLASAEGVSGWWRDAPDQAVTLTFALPPPSARTRVHGELHLRWSGPTVRSDGRTRAKAAAPAEWEEQGGEAEALVEGLLARLPAHKRATLEREAAPPALTLDRMPVVLEHGSPDVEEPAAAASASVVSRPDASRTFEDERRLRALLAAFRGRVPGPVGEALEHRREKP